MRRWRVASALTVLMMLGLANAAWAQATNIGMVGITINQTLQLNLAAFPSFPIADTPGRHCMAELGFQDSSGKQLGLTKKVSLAVGESASLSLNGRDIIKTAGERLEILPRIVPEGTFTPCSTFLASAEVIDDRLGTTTVGVHGSPGYPPEPVFTLLSVEPGQIARLNVVGPLPARLATAPPSTSPVCVAELSFADANGRTIGDKLNVNLPPGQAAFLDVPGSILSPSNPVHPIVNLAEGVHVYSCIASVEVYSDKSFATAVYWSPPHSLHSIPLYYLISP